MDNNQVIVITGTRKGIGRYLVEYYVDKGFQVIGCSRGTVNYGFENYQHFYLDVSDEEKVKKMFSEIRKTHKRVDVLINNAGIALMSYVLLTPLQAVQNMLNTNFIGSFLFCREAVKIMQGNCFGRIVNISTVAVPLSPIGTSIYSASKSAVEQFSRVLAKEVASYGITVNTLELSFVKGSGMTDEISKKAIKEVLAQTVSKLWLDFKDVAHTIDFLISLGSDRVTGQTFCLGGI